MRMKWQYWLILELLAIFETMAWIYFFPGDFEQDFGKAVIGFVIIISIEYYKKIKGDKE